MMQMIKAKVVALVLGGAVAAGAVGSITVRKVWAQRESPVAASAVEPAATATASSPQVEIAAIPAAVEASPESVAAARKQLVERIAKLHNLSAEFDMTANVTRSPEEIKAIMIVVQRIREELQKERPDGQLQLNINNGITQYHGRYSILGARISSDLQLSDADELRAAESLAFSPESWVITPERIERLVGPVHAHPTGAIQGPKMKEFPFEWTLDLGLGLRSLGGSALFTEKDLGEGTLRQLVDGNWGLTLPENNMTGHWIFDPKNDFALVRYIITENSKVRHEIVCSNFKPFSGTSLPTKIIRRQCSTSGGKTWTNETFTVDVQKYTMNDPANIPSRYQMVYPAGAGILDTRSGADFQNREADRSYTDEELAAKAKEGAAR
jgi:hypothetical protein